MCNNADLMLGYVYGELPDADRREFDAHLALCARCREEVIGLRAVRSDLALWAPPRPEFELPSARRGTGTASAPRRLWSAPGWRLAAAAVLVLAAAAAVANVEVRYDAAGLMVRTGWAPGDASAPAPSASFGSARAPAAADEWQARVAALEARLRQLESAAASRQTAGAPQLASGPRLTDAEILRRVREIVTQSETRQQRELAMQISQIVKDVDNARRLDFLRIQQGMGQLRGQTSAEVAQQLNYYLSRVSQQK